MERASKTENNDMTGTIAYSVAESAYRLKCKAIFAPTISGYTARKISRFRPECPVVAISPSLNTVKSLALHFGVYPVLIDDLKALMLLLKSQRK